jgi:prepilin-type N-terminal cleavage/methylation domain-containing protein
MSALADRLRDQRGFTLIELQMSILIGVVVLSAIMGLTEVAGRASSRTGDRVEVAQRARVAMERMTRPLRSQVCLNSTTYPIISGTDDSITFYTDYDSVPLFRPQKRVFTYDPAGTGKLKEEVYESTTTTGPPWTFPATPTRTFDIATHVGKVGTTPFLRYYAPGSTTPMSTPLSADTTTTPLPDNSVARVVRVELSFETLPTSGYQETERRTGLRNQVFLRNSDTQGPRCD